MRADLAKLVTERPRIGRSGAITKKYGGRVRIHPDPDYDYSNEVGGFHSSARRRHKTHKIFSDNLNPIYGVLHKNLGRPWDDVHSEFCEFLDRRSLSGWHVYKQHLMREVEQNVYLHSDGKVYEYQAGRYSSGDIEVYGFYVHPLTGLLCHNGEYARGRHRYSWPKAPKPVEHIKISASESYELLEVGRGKNRFKAWFYMRKEIVVDGYWKPVIPVLHAFGHYKNQLLHTNDAGEICRWVETDKVILHKKSCNRKQIQQIKQFLQK